MKAFYTLLIILIPFVGYGQIIDIPDVNFKEFLLESLNVDTNGDSEIQVIEANTYASSINVNSLNIYDLSGIEYFTSIPALFCSSNQLTYLDVSQNTALTQLSCNDNQLTYLDVSQNTALTQLSCFNNQLTNLNVSQNTALISLICSNNQLTNLDVSQNTALYKLFCSSNQLTYLDVSQNTALTQLYCTYNQLTSLDLRNGNYLNLTHFFCKGNTSLYCINVDNPNWFTDNLSFLEPINIDNIDPQHYFSSDCLPSWNCLNDACVEPMDGSGVYSSLNDCEQKCQNISSINENIIDVNIYPNPSSNIFNIELNSDSKAEISVTNILGEQVYFESTKSIGEYNTQIDLSNYSKGIYNLTIKTSDGISNHKLILQ